MKISKVALILVSGLAIGAVTGLLVAPQKGSASRKKLIKKGKKYKKDFEDEAEKIKDKVVRVKQNIEGAAHDVQKRFS